MRLSQSFSLVRQSAQSAQLVSRTQSVSRSVGLSQPVGQSMSISRTQLDSVGQSDWVIQSVNQIQSASQSIRPVGPVSWFGQSLSPFIPSSIGFGVGIWPELKLITWTTWCRCGHWPILVHIHIIRDISSRNMQLWLCWTQTIAKLISTKTRQLWQHFMIRPTGVNYVIMLTTANTWPAKTICTNCFIWLGCKRHLYQNVGLVQSGNRSVGENKKLHIPK